MRRREFITLLGGAAAVWPFAARAQQATKLPTIGFLGAVSASFQRPWVDAFVQRLREHGWIEGRSISIEYRWGEGRPDRFAEIAAEFVRLKVDVIVTSGTPPVLAAKQATTVIPIVFAAAGDPVGTGLVSSLARPGGNVTGLSNQLADLGAKKLEFLSEAVPALRHLAIMWNVDNPFALLEVSEVRTAAHTLGLKLASLEIRRSEDIAAAFEALKRPNAGPLRGLRPTRGHQPCSHQYIGARCSTAHDARRSGLRGSGWSDVLCTEYSRYVSPRRRPC